MCEMDAAFFDENLELKRQRLLEVFREPVVGREVLADGVGGGTLRVLRDRAVRLLVSLPHHTTITRLASSVLSFTSINKKSTRVFYLR